MQESARKDVERAFGVLMARFAIIKTPARIWKKEILDSIMKTCVILHNIIIENDKDDPIITDAQLAGNSSEVQRIRPKNQEDFSRFLSRYNAVHDCQQHLQLRNDLIEHLWAIKGDADSD